MNAPIAVTAAVTNFMERVVAWPGPTGAGFINLHWTKAGADGKPRWRGAPYKTAQEFLKRAQRLAANPNTASDIYFCTSAQASCATHPKGFQIAERSAANATLVKALWLDVDVKDPPKGYATSDEALHAIASFVVKAGLPKPSAYVYSGGGIHVYWFSNRPLTPEEWRPYAAGLKAEAIRLELRADYGCTTDVVRILRVPGTFNRKIPGQPRPVSVGSKTLGPDYDFSRDLASLAAIGVANVTAAVTKSAPIDLSGFQGGMASDFAVLSNETDSLSDGLKRHNDLPLHPLHVFKECPHYREAFKIGGKGHGQGLWHLTVLGTTWFENGRDFAHACSNKHPSYDEDETNAMYDRKLKERAERGLGWPSCKAFENEGCKLCATCIHRGKIKSPLNLANLTRPYQANLTAPTEPSFVDPYGDFVGPEFPVEVLPPTLAKFVDTEHRAMGADSPAIAMAALAAVAGAMHAETRVRAGEGWWERPILWVALVGLPSTMKSPIIDKTTRPLIQIDHDRDKQWRQEYAIWQSKK